jgi:apolipoprotein N-acyltransferase
MQKLKSVLKIYMLPILTGIFVGTTYIPFFPWALAFCLVPLWLFMWKNQHSLKKLFWGAWVAQFVFNLIGFHWVAHTTIEYGGFPAPAGYVILLLFASIAHLYYPIAAVLWGWCAKRCRPVTAWVLMPVILAVCESFYPTIFFWHLGYPWLWINLPGAHAAEWIGFYGLQLVTLAMNLGVLFFVKEKRKRGLVFAAALFIVVNGAGYYLKQRFQEGDKTLKVLAVQANIGNAIKVEQDRGPYFHHFILREFLELTAEGLKQNPDTQLIVWPETAYPSRVTKDHPDDFQGRLRYSISSFQVPLLTGAYEQDDKKRVYNSLVLFDKDGNMVSAYRKTMLLAFGEYFPGSSVFPQLIDWFPMVSDFGRGTGPEVLKFGDLNIGAQICYESLFDDDTRVLFSKNANIIVNVTNDSWFGKAFEPYQHLYMTLARAIEFRIPLIRSTNTGITTAISAGGKIQNFSPLHQKWTGAFTVHYKSQMEPTVYSHFAGQWPWILLILFLALLAGERIAKRRSK